MLTIAEAQAVLQGAGVYTGAVDGIGGPKTRLAVAAMAARAGDGWSAWPPDRQLVAAVQAALAEAGYDPGAIDGWAGYNTREALEDWRALGRREFRRPPPVARPDGGARRWPREADLDAVFGPPAGPEASAGRIAFPFPFRLGWATGRRVSGAACHRLVAPVFTGLFAAASGHYGEERYRQLGLDLWYGCYNPRRKRGGTAWSTHAWGIAFDLDADNNQLRWGADLARFARPEYEPWWKIVEAQGLTSLGRAANYDWMHVQAARL
ncbi:MAG: hypothetical protein H5U20_03585 [Rhodobacteraceae bacterium]|nr:hypothetical protein [Paracoccaceae bacterium]